MSVEVRVASTNTKVERLGKQLHAEKIGDRNEL